MYTYIISMLWRLLGWVDKGETIEIEMVPLPVPGPRSYPLPPQWYTSVDLEKYFVDNMYRSNERDYENLL